MHFVLAVLFFWPAFWNSMAAPAVTPTPPADSRGTPAPAAASRPRHARTPRPPRGPSRLPHRRFGPPTRGWVPDLPRLTGAPSFPGPWGDTSLTGSDNVSKSWHVTPPAAFAGSSGQTNGAGPP